MLFGDLTGELVAYGYAVRANYTEPDADAFLDAVGTFALYNSILGVVMLIVTYISVWTYNFVANRQVRNFWLCDIVIMFFVLQQHKRAYLNTAYAEVSTLGFFTE